MVLKEIKDQKVELKTFFEEAVPKIIDHKFLETLKENLEKEFLFLGCGSSYNLAFIISHYFERVLGVKTKVIPAGEVAFNKASKIPDKGLVFLFSRTGNTTEVLMAKNILKRKGYTTVGVTIEQSSKLAKESDFSLVFPIEESAIVMTKSLGTFTVTTTVLVSLGGTVMVSGSTFTHRAIEYFVLPGFLMLYAPSTVSTTSITIAFKVTGSKSPSFSRKIS